ncbi:MAG: class I fructose-bisphosphate aldolase, partial [Pseudomonadota bacterium]
DPAGIKAIVAQQFEVGRQISSHGLMPILEPEVTISIADKAEAEKILRDEIAAHLNTLAESEQIMLKLTLPEEANFYKPLINDARVLKAVALSGGYSRTDANARLAQNAGMIASFSRALTEGLSAKQSDDTFNAMIADTIDSIHAASVAG